MDYSRDPLSRLPPVAFEPPDDFTAVFWPVDNPRGKDFSWRASKYVGPQYDRLFVHDLLTGRRQDGIVQITAGGMHAFLDKNGLVVAGDRRALELIGWLTTPPAQTP